MCFDALRCFEDNSDESEDLRIVYDYNNCLKYEIIHDGFRTVNGSLIGLEACESAQACF
jgi:hypothetical protein